MSADVCRISSCYCCYWEHLKFWNDHNQLELEISLVKCHAYNIWTHVAHFNDLNIFEYLLAAVDLGPKSAATYDHQGMISMMNPRVAEQVFNPVLPKSRGAFRHVIWMKKKTTVWAHPPKYIHFWSAIINRVSGPWLYTTNISTYIYIYVGCFTQIHEVNVKMLHYIFRLGKQIYKSNV